MTRRHTQALLEKLPRAGEIQRDLLLDLVEKNLDCEFGKSHGFGEIKTADQFRRRVPIRTYQEYLPWLSKVDVGCSGIISSEPTVCFLSSSGSTGTPKRIPVTASYLRMFIPFISAASERLYEACPAVEETESTINFRFDVPAAAADTAEPRGLSQIDIRAVLGIEPPREAGLCAPWSSVPGHVEKHLDRMYYRIRLAAESDIRCIVGVNPAILANLVGLIDAWSGRLIAEMKAGTVLGRRELPPNPTHARKLEALREHFGELRPYHVWPRLQALFLWPTSVASIYIDRVREAYGPWVSVVPAAVGASEAPMALPLEPGSRAGVLTVDSAFYEFAPATEPLEANSDTLLFDELEVGDEYHVVVSQCAGFYRYAIGDVLRVTDKRNGVPCLEYSGRKTDCAPGGCLVTEGQLLRALKTALDGTRVRLSNFTVVPMEGSEAGYRYVVDPEVALVAGELARLQRRLEHALCQTSHAYRAGRRAGRLEEATVWQTKPGRFAERWAERVQDGLRPAQAKDRILHDSSAVLEELGLSRDGAPVTSEVPSPGLQ